MGVDVTDVPGLDAADVFVLLGRDGDETISAEDVAAARGTITWEVLQTLSARLARVYTLDGSVVAQRSPASMRLSTALDLEPALTRTAAAMRQAGAARPDRSRR
jgi:alanine racemase